MSETFDVEVLNIECDKDHFHFLFSAKGGIVHALCRIFSMFIFSLGLILISFFIPFFKVILSNFH
nr:hypothetical protein [Methanosarcina sp. WH1]